MKVALIQLLFLVMSLALFAQSKNDSVVFWDENRKLTWSDFKGNKPDSMINSNINAICPAEIYIVTNWNSNIPKFEIQVYFSKYKAWAIDTNSLILTHEQLHFDIAELFARKISRQIQILNNKKVSDLAQYEKVINSLLAERRKVNIEYDSATLHGNSITTQQKWNIKIKNQLNLLKDYKTNYQ